MKKWMVVLIMIALVSCTKEANQMLLNSDVHELSVKPLPTYSPIPAPTRVTEAYDSHITSPCTGESIHLTGIIVYETNQYTSLGNKYLIYNIYLQEVVGIGEITGRRYTGGGKSLSTTITSTFPKSRAAYGRQIYDMRYYTSDSTHYLISTQDAEYQANIRGKVLINYNYVNDLCK